MPVTIKFEYQDEFCAVEEAVRAEEKQGFLIVYDRDGGIAGRFTLSKIEHWWIGSPKKDDTF